MIRMTPNRLSVLVAVPLMAALVGLAELSIAGAANASAPVIVAQADPSLPPGHPAVAPAGPSAPEAPATRRPDPADPVMRPDPEVQPVAPAPSSAQPYTGLGGGVPNVTESGHAAVTVGWVLTWAAVAAALAAIVFFAFRGARSRRSLSAISGNR